MEGSAPKHKALTMSTTLITALQEERTACLAILQAANKTKKRLLLIEETLRTYGVEVQPSVELNHQHKIPYSGSWPERVLVILNVEPATFLKPNDIRAKLTGVTIDRMTGIILATACCRLWKKGILERAKLPGTHYWGYRIAQIPTT